MLFCVLLLCAWCPNVEEISENVYTPRTVTRVTIIYSVSCMANSALGYPGTENETFTQNVNIISFDSK